MAAIDDSYKSLRFFERERERGDSGPVWYVCLKTENCCLKTFVKICVGEKVR